MKMREILIKFAGSIILILLLIVVADRDKEANHLHNVSYEQRQLSKLNIPDWVPKDELYAIPQNLNPTLELTVPNERDKAVAGLSKSIQQYFAKRDKKEKSNLRYPHREDTDHTKDFTGVPRMTNHRLTQTEYHNSSRNELRRNSYSKLFKPLLSNTVANSTSCLLMDPHSHLPKTKDHVILAFVDTKFFPLYHNWHLHFIDVCGKSRINQLELVCIDEGVSSLLEKLQLNCSQHSFVIPKMGMSGMFSIKRQASIWLRRMEVILWFLQHNIDLILTDSDAIWRSDPYLDLNQYYDRAEIIASRGSFPATLFSNWGATICMGYIFLKSSPFTIHFMEAVLQDMRSRAIIMERIQEEIIIRERQLGVMNETMRAKTSRAAILRERHERQIQKYLNDRKRKSLLRVRTNETLPDTNPQVPSAISSIRAILGQRLLLDNEKDSSISAKQEDIEEEETDIPDLSKVADNLVEDEEAINSEGDNEPKAKTNVKYSSHAVVEEVAWIESNDMMVYNPALEIFHHQLLSNNISLYLRSSMVSSNTAERQGMDLLHFLYDIRDLEGNKPDDQYTMNYILYQWKIQWKRERLTVVERGNLQPDYGTITYSTTSTGSSAATATIILLPHMSYLRNCTGIPYHRRTRGVGYRNAKRAVAKREVVIAHCLLSPGDANKKYLSLRSFKLWHQNAPKVSQIKYGRYSDWIPSLPSPVHFENVSISKYPQQSMSELRSGLLPTALDRQELQIPEIPEKSFFRRRRRRNRKSRQEVPSSTAESSTALGS